MMTWRLHWVSVRNFGLEDFLTSIFGVSAKTEIRISIFGLGEGLSLFMEHFGRAEARKSSESTYP